MNGIRNLERRKTAHSKKPPSLTIGKEKQLNKKPPILIPRKIGILKTEKPSFLTLQKFSLNEPKSLVITSFKMMGKHTVKVVPNMGRNLDNISSIKPKLLTNEVTWPNGVTPVPEKLFGSKGLLIAGGFLVPSSSTGAVTFIDLNNTKKIQLTKDKLGWFYHMTKLVDMNDNGRPDILTARAIKPMTGGKPKGELVWLENPGTPNKEWKEHIIMSGPDVNFVVHDINNDGKKEIITTDFFSKKLRLIWKENDTFKSKILDKDIGCAFDLKLADINGNGKMDLLVTNHENPNGSVFTYEIPKDFKKDTWKRHTILENIKTTKKGPFQASPGQALAFYPHRKMKETPHTKPYILVAGDGSGKVHLLVPESNDQNNWKYNEKILLESNSIVGQLAVGDTNQDGYTEFFAPLFDKNEIHAFTFKDSKVLKN